MIIASILSGTVGNKTVGRFSSVDQWRVRVQVNEEVIPQRLFIPIQVWSPHISLTEYQQLKPSPVVLSAEETAATRNAQDTSPARTNILLGSINVQTLAHQGQQAPSIFEEDGDIARLDILLEEFKQTGFDVVAMQETRVRRKLDGTHPLYQFNDYNVLFSGVAKKGEGTTILGTGIAIRTRYPIMWSACPNDRLVCIFTRFSNTPIAIISAYGPTEINSDLDAKQKFYTDLKKLVASVPKEYQNNVVIPGDFNARIGEYSDDSDDAIRG